MKDLKLPSRKTVVTSVKVSHHRRKHVDASLPNGASKNPEEPMESSQVSFSMRSGLLPEHYITVSCEDAGVTAEELAALWPVGSEIPEPDHSPVDPSSRQYIEGKIDGPSFGSVSAVDQMSSLAWEVLREAGISCKCCGSPVVEILDSLGKQRIDALKGRFGENWSEAAEFEYCWLNLSHSSPAYIAAAYNYHYFITEDAFSAGYLLRDLECLVHGAEAKAVKAIETRNRAGEAGGKQSAQARDRRRAAVMEKMETVVRRNPDVVRLGPDTAARLALAECIDAAPDLWAQGKGQVKEYLGEIRRGEAGKDMQARYRALFPPETV